MNTLRKMDQSKKTNLLLPLSAIALVLVLNVDTAGAYERLKSTTTIQLPGVEDADFLLLVQNRIHIEEEGPLRFHDGAIYNHVYSWLAFGLTYYLTPEKGLEDSYHSNNDSYYSNQKSDNARSMIPGGLDLLPDGFMFVATLNHDLNF